MNEKDVEKIYENYNNLKRDIIKSKCIATWNICFIISYMISFATVFYILFFK